MSAYDQGVQALRPWAWTVRDKTFAEYDGQLDGYLSANATLLDGDVGNWSLTLPRNHPMTGIMLTEGAGVVVRPYGLSAPLFSGPLSHDEITFAQDGSSVTVTGPTDEVELASDVCWPDPLHALTAGTNITSGAKDSRTGVAETVLLGYIKDNIGSTAYHVAFDRRRSYLTVPASSGRGSSVALQADMDQILVMAKAACLTSGITWRIIQSGAGLAVVIRARADVSDNVVLSRREGSLKAATFSRTSPTATQVIAGSDDGTTRAYIVQTDGTAETLWGRRFVTVVDANSSTIADLTQAATDGIAAGAETAGATMEALVLPKAPQFGIDYFLGDTLSVVDDSGVVIKDALAQMTYQHNAGAGPQLQPSIGYASIDETSAFVPDIRKIQAKVAILSRRAT